MRGPLKSFDDSLNAATYLFIIAATVYLAAEVLAGLGKIPRFWGGNG